jgi:hypothetical protein
VVVKARVPDADGYNWLHGAAVCWRKGKLSVIYSNDGGRGGNRNSCEMAIIPINQLSAD